MPLVRQSGFVPNDEASFVPIGAIPGSGEIAIDLPADGDPSALVADLGRISLIRIPFSSSSDGRGFSLARRIRDLGYRGRLRAHGHLISDQFRYALECGFDEVEIDDALAQRQPEGMWSVGRLSSPSYREKLSGRPRPQDFSIPDGVHVERVTDVQHYGDRLFRFRMTRPPSFRFRSGEFVMIGLPNAEKPVFRAYSIATPSWDDELEFYSIKVANGPLTEHLQRIVPGDRVLMRKKSTGTLVLDALVPGRRLYLLATGTGMAPFASLIRDPETYEKFDAVILTNTCRLVSELTYGDEIVAAAKDDPLVGELARERLRYYPTTTRDDSPRVGRITSLIEDGTLFADLGTPAISPETDRVMICGSLAMVRQTRALMEDFGLSEGSNGRPGEFVVERAFVD